MKSIEVEAIYSVTSRGFIGLGPDVICPIPEDFKHFQSKTRGHILVMGYKTWMSIPNKDRFILSDGSIDQLRRIVVLTNRAVKEEAKPVLSESAGRWVRYLREPSPVDLISTIREAYSNEFNDIFNQLGWSPKLIVAGGARIYEKYMGVVDLIHETLVLTTKEGDVKLPIGLTDGFEFRAEDPTFRTSKNGEVYRFHTYDRV